MSFVDIFNRNAVHTVDVRENNSCRMKGGDSKPEHCECLSNGYSHHFNDFRKPTIVVHVPLKPNRMTVAPCEIKSNTISYYYRNITLKHITIEKLL